MELFLEFFFYFVFFSFLFLLFLDFEDIVLFSTNILYLLFGRREDYEKE